RRSTPIIPTNLHPVIPAKVGMTGFNDAAGVASPPPTSKANMLQGLKLKKASLPPQWLQAT
ncbi:TPA: hypothetical protein ACLBH4_002100, partial [Neisseria meningitidis]